MTGSPLRLRLRSTSAPPLDDDDLLTEILLRLSPNPSSLPRASVVCTRWRGIISDPGFLRRFRLRHRSSAPILGWFRTDLQRPRVSFVPTLEAPDRVPAERFSLQLVGYYYRFRPLNCRHGLVLIILGCRMELLVWDPVTGDQHRLAVPRGFLREERRIEGAVIRAARVVHHFQVVLVGFDEKDRKRAIGRVYSSETGSWGNPVSTLLPDEVLDDTDFFGVPAVSVGDSVYWFISGSCSSSRILGFDLHRQMLSVMPVPSDFDRKDRCQFMFMHAEGGGLGFLAKSGCKVQLWKMESDCDGLASWALGRTIELDRLLPLDPEEKESSSIIGYAEYSNVMFLRTVIGHFTLHLESLKFEKTFDTHIWFLHQPLECVYTGEMGIGGAPGGADLLHNA
uniref:Uncharacterized protein n=1 Tax=Avena sativa TaxID=4498 RepID=A0ACD5ZA22_AVESA